MRRGHAVEGVSRGRRAPSVCCPPARGGEDGRPLRGVWDLAEDRLQDLRAVQGLWPAGVYGPEPAAASAGQPAAAGGRGDDRSVETRVSGLGRPEDSREVTAAVPRAPSA